MSKQVEFLLLSTFNFSAYTHQFFRCRLLKEKIMSGCYIIIPTCYLIFKKTEFWSNFSFMYLTTAKQLFWLNPCFDFCIFFSEKKSIQLRRIIFWGFQLNQMLIEMKRIKCWVWAQDNRDFIYWFIVKVLIVFFLSKFNCSTAYGVARVSDRLCTLKK